MALISQIPVVDVAAVAARALEELLGHDVALTTGTVVLGVPAYDMVADDATRTVVLPFRDGLVGEVTLVVDERFAAAMEAVAPDAALTTAALPALLAGADAIAFATTVGVDPDDAREIATGTLFTGGVGDVAAVPLFENDARVGCVVVRVVDEAPHEERSHNGVAGHEFQPLGGPGSVAAPARPLPLLNDVVMEVTAELGRRRLKVRDIVSLQPGSVLELDRPAGSPVDVLVNGALVFRGEVVVADDDLGVRVSDVVVDDASTPRAER